MTPKRSRTDSTDGVRVLKPSELESLKGGAQPGPDAPQPPALPPPSLKPTP